MTTAPSPAGPAVLGTWRAVDPPGTLLHLADRIDATSAANEYEAEIDVEILNLDATSFRQLTAAEPDAAGVARAIAGITRRRGKMHNPVTSSGGVLVGRVAAVGAARSDGVTIGDRVIPLASLIATPLRLTQVGPVDVADPQVPVAGRAIVTGRMPVAVVPTDLPLPAVLTAIDVYPAASHTRAMASTGDHVAVLGAGHAGLAAVAAAREAAGPDGLVTVVDLSDAALAAAALVDPAALTVRADATRPVEVMEAVASLARPPADLTLLCTTVPGCEGAAMLLTAETGTVLFFSTATSFSAAALGADALSLTTRLVIPNGYTPDGGGYLLDLLRRTPALLAAYVRPRG